MRPERRREAEGDGQGASASVKTFMHAHYDNDNHLLSKFVCEILQASSLGYCIRARIAPSARKKNFSKMETMSLMYLLPQRWTKSSAGGRSKREPGCSNRVVRASFCTSIANHALCHMRALGERYKQEWLGAWVAENHPPSGEWSSERRFPRASSCADFKQFQKAGVVSNDT